MSKVLAARVDAPAAHTGAGGSMAVVKDELTTVIGIVILCL